MFGLVSVTPEVGNKLTSPATREKARVVRTLIVILAAAGCSSDVADKLAPLPIRQETRAALARLRFQQLRDNDHLERGDVVLCGARDRALLGFSKKLVVGYLGRDSDWLIPELFTSEKEDEVLLAVPPKQLMRLELPRGIGAEGEHPDAWVREVAGYPLFTSDLRGIDALFESGEVRELFALRDEVEVETAAAAKSVTARTAAEAKSRDNWSLGVQVFPRMGPRTGVVISDVTPGSPADATGLVRGDRIIQFGGQPVGSFRELKRAIVALEEPVVTLEILKKSNKAKIEVTVDLSD